jgi:hypothetical protein
MLNALDLKRSLVLAGLFFPTAAMAAHWDRPSCYIDVHSGCYVNQKHPCSEAEYKDFLRMCDDTYPANQGVIGKKKKLYAPG